MTSQERSQALTAFGFTPRQASFLVLVMLHAGVCLSRQYCTHAGIVRGQRSHDSFARLLARGFATATRTAHGGTALYHIHGKRLYRAIGEPDHRHRRPVTLARAIERLMVLDGLLADPDTAWLATPDEKAAHFTQVAGVSLADLPRRGPHDGPTAARVFPNALPIGCARDGGAYVLLFLVTHQHPLDFRGFLHRHHALLRALRRWEIRLLVPARLAGALPGFEAAALEELASPLAPSEPADLRWYFDQVGRVSAGHPSEDPARFASLRRAFAIQRYWALYRTWRAEGDGRLYEATSPLLRAAMDADEGRVTPHVLTHDYLRLTALVGTA